MKKYLLGVLIFTIGLEAFCQSNGTEAYEDNNYKSFIKTVQLYPNNSQADREMQTPIISLQSRGGMMLEFDALLEDYLFLQARLVHCNADWKPSRLSDFQFLSEFNAFDLNQFEYSVNTKTLFVHYVFEVPLTKVSGNYALVVYQNNDVEDVVLTKRFVVYEHSISISPTVRLSSGVSARNFNQQVEFNLKYNQLNVSNPLTDFHVVVRQNQRWDNAIIGLKPTLVRRDQKYLEYHHFTMENNFKGGNEFRFFDLRTYNFRGQNVAHINKESNPMTATLRLSDNRSKQVYSQFRDLNGQYFVESREPQADILEADYINTTFQLNSTREIGGNVYVIGTFNDWKQNESSRLTYDEARQLYTTAIPLKQGVYSYMFWAENDPYYFEGSFFQTENQYEILVYFRAPGFFADRVVGYQAFYSGN